MKYSPLNYAQALSASWQETPAAQQTGLIKNFLALVNKNGDRHKIDSILIWLEKLETKQLGGRLVVVESARTIPTAVKEKITARFAARDRLKFQENEKLIAGLRVTIDGERELDLSFARRLRQLFVK